ncbi:hypothetical protein [Paenibacillus sp. LjRoot153]|uniref:hypothetical protein n=1 Tax=Paenibacillus sp. LjRoot153 TaxID=3342270 RepID=UPI003F503889
MPMWLSDKLSNEFLWKVLLCFKVFNSTLGKCREAIKTGDSIAMVKKFIVERSANVVAWVIIGKLSYEEVTESIELIKDSVSETN